MGVNVDIGSFVVWDRYAKVNLNAVFRLLVCCNKVEVLTGD